MDDLYLSNLSGDERDIIKFNRSVSITEAAALIVKALPEMLERAVIHVTKSTIEAYPIPHEIEGFTGITFQFIGGKEFSVPIYPGAQDEFTGTMAYTLIIIASDYFKERIAPHSVRK